jgi:hypothetical protein
MFTRLTVKHRLWLSFGIVIALGVISALLIAVKVNHIRGSIDDVTNHFTPQILAIAEIRRTVIMMSLETRHAMIVKTEPEREKTLGSLEPCAKTSSSSCASSRPPCIMKKGANASRRCRPAWFRSCKAWTRSAR